MLVSPLGGVVTSLPPPKETSLLDCMDCKLREIVFWPDERLWKQCQDVDDPTSDEIRKLAGDLAYTMYFMGGVGLSAPQFGERVRVCVLDIFNGRPPKPGQRTSQLLVLVNPQIVWNDGVLKDSAGEGCLSIPSVVLGVKRHQSIVVEGVDLEGKQWSLKTTGFLSCVIQHEVDHLDGVVMFDRAKQFDRRKAEGAYRKFQAAIQGNINEDVTRRNLKARLKEAEDKEAERGESPDDADLKPKPKKVKLKRHRSEKKRSVSR